MKRERVYIWYKLYDTIKLSWLIRMVVGYVVIKPAPHFPTEDTIGILRQSGLSYLLIILGFPKTGWKFIWFELYIMYNDIYIRYICKNM